MLAVTAAGLLLAAAPARAFDLKGLAGKAGGAAKDKVVKDVNAKLLAEGHKNQCSFKSDSDQLAPGCDKKIKKLADTLIDAKKKLQAGGVNGFKFAFFRSQPRDQRIQHHGQGRLSLGQNADLDRFLKHVRLLREICQRAAG